MAVQTCKGTEKQQVLPMFGHLGRNNLKRIISNCCAKGKTIILNDYRNIEEMVTGFFENLETEIV